MYDMGKKLCLELDDEESIIIGLLRLSNHIPVYQFFYEINKINNYNFKRANDFIVSTYEINYEFLRMQSYDKEEKAGYQIIANKSFPVKANNEFNLFGNLEHEKYLLEDRPDVDFLIKITGSSPDFSLILFPENLVFPVQNYEITSDQLIYQYIQENE